MSEFKLPPVPGYSMSEGHTPQMKSINEIEQELRFRQDIQASISKSSHAD